MPPRRQRECTRPPSGCPLSHRRRADVSPLSRFHPSPRDPLRPRVVSGTQGAERERGPRPGRAREAHAAPSRRAGGAYCPLRARRCTRELIGELPLTLSPPPACKRPRRAPCFVPRTSCPVPRAPAPRVPHSAADNWPRSARARVRHRLLAARFRTLPLGPPPTSSSPSSPTPGWARITPPSPRSALELLRAHRRRARHRRGGWGRRRGRRRRGPTRGRAHGQGPRAAGDDLGQAHVGAAGASDAQDGRAQGVDERAHGDLVQEEPRAAARGVGASLRPFATSSPRSVRRVRCLLCVHSIGLTFSATTRALPPLAPRFSRWMCRRLGHWTELGCRASSTYRRACPRTSGPRHLHPRSRRGCCAPCAATGASTSARGARCRTATSAARASTTRRGASGGSFSRARGVVSLAISNTAVLCFFIASLQPVGAQLLRASRA